MKKKMVFKEISEKEFLEFSLKALNKNFVQSLEMYNRYKSLKKEVFLVGVESDKGLLAAGLVVKARNKLGKKIFKMPYGWIGGYEEDLVRTMREGLINFVLERDGMVIFVSPYVENLESEVRLEGFKYLGEYEQVKWMYVLDFGGREEEEILKAMRGNARRQIRTTEKLGVMVRELENKELCEMEKLLEEAGKRHGFVGPKLKYFEEMKEFFGDRVKFLVAEKEIGGEREILAGVMLVFYGEEVIYLYGGTREKYREFGAQYLLQWSGIKMAIKNGAKRYNFYGVRPVEEDGVYRFKQGFRGRVVELAGTFVLPVGIMGKLYAMRLKKQKYGKCV